MIAKNDRVLYIAEDVHNGERLYIVCYANLIGKYSECSIFNELNNAIDLYDEINKTLL